MELHAVVAADLRRITGSMLCETGGSGELALAVYPRALRQEEALLDDVSRPWLYPRGASVADMTLSLAGRPLEGSGPWQTLGHAEAGSRIEVRFETTVPERNGSFGRREGVLYALGGWHPAFGAADAPLPSSVIDYDVMLPSGVAGMLGGHPVGSDAPRRVRGRFVGRFVPLLVAGRLRVEREAGAVIVVASARTPPPPAREALAGAWHLSDISAGGDDAMLAELRETLAQGERFATRQGLAPRPLLAIVAPLREHLVERFDAGLVVSDRIFHVPSFDFFSWLGVPEDLFARFHRLRLWREQLGFFAEPLAASAERDLPPALAADAVAVALRDRLVGERYGEKKFANDFLEPIAVIPEIEALVAAPQIPFIDAYYDAIDEAAAHRRSLDDFAHHLPRGKLLYEKLVDQIGVTKAQAVIDAYLQGPPRPLLELARAAGGERLEQWLGPYPKVDYALGSVSDDAGVIGVNVVASGGDASQLLEPVTVAIEDRNGAPHRSTRLGPGPLRFASPGPATLVELDPQGRLVELAKSPGEDPRFNNRQPPRWRFLLNNITGLIAATNQQVSFTADFSLRRVHDLRWRYDFRGSYSPEALSLVGALSYGFGEEVTALRLAERLGLSVSADRLLPERNQGSAGYELTAGAFYQYDTRLSALSSYAGEGLAAHLSAGLCQDRNRGDYRFLQASASAFRLFPLGSYQALLLRLRGDLTLGDAPVQEQLRLGGRYTAGRGFEPDEAYGAQRAVVSFEHRHALAVDTRTDFLGAFMLTGIEGALFGDAVYLPVRRAGCRRDLFYDAGYGVRFLVDVLDLSPSSFAVDVGVPLNRCGDEETRVPVTVYMAFVQSFLAF
jgi:hypothetical protein